MGRRSLAAERREQIIAATISCVSTHGIGGTTLERIAETAGMGRGHVRHYAGNRDELLTDAARAFYFGPAAAEEKTAAAAATSAPLIAPESSLDDALTYLLDDFASPGTEDAAAFAFMDASRTMPAIREIVLAAYDGMQQSMEQILARDRPQSSPAARRTAAYALITLAIGHLWFMDLEVSPTRVADLRRQVEDIIAGLGHVAD